MEILYGLCSLGLLCLTKREWEKRQKESTYLMLKGLVQEILYRRNAVEWSEKELELLRKPFLSIQDKRVRNAFRGRIDVQVDVWYEETKHLDFKFGYNKESVTEKDIRAYEEFIDRYYRCGKDLTENHHM